MTEPVCRLCGPESLEDILRLQARVCAALENKDIFMPSTREEYAGYFEPLHGVYGAFCGETLTGYCTFAFPGAPGNDYSRDLGWPPEIQARCGKIDTVAVAPEYRGLGLQRRMVHRAVEAARRASPEGILLATVSPYNPYSLRNMQAEGFVVLHRLLKYGGRERFIVGRALGEEPLPAVCLP